MMISEETKKSIKKVFPTKFKSPLEVFWNINGNRVSDNMQSFDSASKDAILEDNLLLGLTDQFVEADVIKVHFIDGEPLLRGEIITKIIPRLASKGILVSIETSGYGLNQSLLEFFKRYDIHITLILDSDNPKTHNTIHFGDSNFEVAVCALEKLNKGKIPTTIKTNIYKINMEELGGIVDFVSYYESVKKVEFHTVINVVEGKEIPWFEIPFTSIQQIIDMITEKNREYVGQPYCSLINHSNDIKKLRTLPHNNYCMYINCNGDTYANKYLPFSFGNVRVEKLLDIWEWGLNNCYRDRRMFGILKKVHSLKELVSLWSECNYKYRDFYSL